MTGQGTRGSTGGLLNGAIALGLSIEGELKQRPISLPQYVFDLIFSYHNTRRAPGHFRKAADCFRALNRPEIASYLETHAREEKDTSVWPSRTFALWACPPNASSPILFQAA